ncbi:MAG: sulfurtransferase [Actinomycetia bacterium]|nr:sulfurtransferase [Actinomycetes bacterium]
MAFTHPDYLVETEWLADHLDDSSVRILDVTAKLTKELTNRARGECYDQGHIPGSVFFDVAAGKGVLSDPDAALPWMWPSPERFEAVMAEAGVSNDTRVVIAARTPREGIDSGTMWCTRAWWTMHHMGVGCAILRGGIEKWEAEGRPLVSEPTTPEPATFTSTAGWEAARATKDDVLAAVQSGGACVVDALAESSFDGTDPGYGPRNGHITGATSVPFRSLVDGETALFPDADELRSRLGASRLLEQERIITYCGGAIAATVDAFALALFGHEGVAVYDGSLMEWSADDSLPMTGA